ncbi:MAG TPA: helix-turn-helix domain-containing protein [Solirubrobacterales bacterium]|nr:helix-turn-helix domain-containing protein [Solirubrobacterales bacterium]
MLDLAIRLRERREEIERLVLDRVVPLSEPGEEDDPEYRLGLRGAVSAAVAATIDAVDGGSQADSPLPPELLAQARLAARQGVGLDLVLRRYAAGQAVICDHFIDELTSSGPAEPAQLRRALRSQAALYDRVIGAVAEEYVREAGRHGGSVEERRTELVKMLLAGEPADPGQLRYDLDGWHVGAIVVGNEAEGFIRDLARRTDRRLLLVHPEDLTLWVWFGGRHKAATLEVIDIARAKPPDGLRMAVGEPGPGIAGWRFSHRQAKAAMPLARRGGETLVHYADVCLLASVLQDEVLTRSLFDLYLNPLIECRQGSEPLLETLQAYFAAQRNVTSTAAALQVDRKTVENRLRTVEEQVGRTLNCCAAEIEATMRLKHSGALRWRSQDEELISP